MGIYSLCFLCKGFKFEFTVDLETIPRTINQLSVMQTYTHDGTPIN